MDHEQLVKQIRFHLETIGETNAHHDFERLCMGLARRRIASNILPATGPVSAGGDQGRDAESHWTNLPVELPGSSVFVALASAEPVVLACTTQKKSVASKIQKDIRTICGAGTPVSRIIYFTVTPVAVARRHQLQAKAKKDHKVVLDIWDASAIAEHLADEDLFYLAVSHLKVPSSFAPAPAPPSAALPQWYVEARDRRRLGGSSHPSLGELMDLRTLLRHATFNKDARSDLPDLIADARRLMDSAEDYEIVLRCRYEAVVATYRGLGEMAPVDDLARLFMDEVLASTKDPGLLEDAFVMLQYLYGNWIRQGGSFTKAELDSYFDRLAQVVNDLLQAEPSAKRALTFRSLSARLALTPSYPDDLHSGEYQFTTLDAEGNVEVHGLDNAEYDLDAEHHSTPLRNLDEGMQSLLEIGKATSNIPLFPVTPVAQVFEIMSPFLVDHPLYREVREHLDRATEDTEGKSARGQRALERANRMLESGHLLGALGEVQEAKLNWWRGDTVAHGVEMSLMASELYLRIGLPLAAKQYALSAATLAKSANDPAVAGYIPQGLMQSALCDYSSGMWLSAVSLAKIGVEAHAYLNEAPGDAARHPFLDRLVESQAHAYAIARRSYPACFSVIEPTIVSLFAGDWPKELGSAAAKIADTSYEATSIFADAGTERAYRWSALGREWEVTCSNNRVSVLAAERFIAMLQVILCEMASFDPFFPPGRSTVRVLADVSPGRAPGESADADTHTPGETIKVHLTPIQHLDDKTAHVETSAAVLNVVFAASLRRGTELQSWLDKAFDEGLWHKLLSSRPYDETADLIPETEYAAMAALKIEQPDGHYFPPACELPAFDGYAEGFDSNQHAEMTTRRYRNLIASTRHTVAALMADMDFRLVVERLKQDGWLDWHLLMAIGNIVGNQRLTREGFFDGDAISGLSPSAAMKLMTRPELKEDVLAPDLFTEDTMREYLNYSLPATLNAYGLQCHTNPPDFKAVFQFLGDRFGYWRDDVDHEELFADVTPVQKRRPKPKKAG